ncbi:hypothetical protein [Paenibacillus lutrae]|uniref:Lipoprotein n=1 Tax=Paenibacillus lutrae TaxID=2078573 RepID=A0A7X3JZ67_9BACL|nr:hypothetical protein [Paenibacillus lutrae]MVO99724.1 hypothetical protein [Paenibacillus lutrae]
MTKKFISVLILILSLFGCGQTKEPEQLTIVYKDHQYYLDDVFKGGGLIGRKLGILQKSAIIHAKCDTGCMPPLVKGGEELYEIKDSRDIAVMRAGKYYRFIY